MGRLIGRLARTFFWLCNSLMLTSFCVCVPSELQRETLWSRIHLVPLLQAEADRELMKQIQENRRRESKIMSGVPGWEVDKSVYNDDKYYLSAAVRRTPLPPVD